MNCQGCERPILVTQFANRLRFTRMAQILSSAGTDVARTILNGLYIFLGCWSLTNQSSNSNIGKAVHSRTQCLFHHM